MMNVLIDGECIRIVFIFIIYWGIFLLFNRYYLYICLKVYMML